MATIFYAMVGKKTLHDIGRSKRRKKFLELEIWIGPGITHK